jgi:DNA helicase-2/ATP-dependent DNA helicase PcrA
VDTIAGWALRYAASFPKSSGLTNTTPTKQQWQDVYPAATRILRLSPIQRIVRESYSGVYVDEYQDCTVAQHELVLALADILPCRLLGDPLQGIFDFRGEPAIDWETHVSPTFVTLAGPDEPWRWKNTNPELGAWLQGVRADLLAGRDVVLTERCPVHWVRLDGNAIPVQLTACRGASRGCETVVAICKRNEQGHKIVRSLGGMYSSVEPIECPDLFKWATRICNAHGFQRAVEVIDFAATCLTGIASEVKTPRNAFAAGRRPGTKKHAEVIDALVAVAEAVTLTPVVAALESLGKVPRVPPDRRELLAEMKRSIREHTAGKSGTLLDAAWRVRNRTRTVGRRLARFCMGTTWLVKGLEFDHAVVLNADGLSPQHLYVALTRGRKMLTVLSKERTLRPTYATDRRSSSRDGGG